MKIIVDKNQKEKIKKKIGKNFPAGLLFYLSLRVFASFFLTVYFYKGIKFSIIDNFLEFVESFLGALLTFLIPLAIGGIIWLIGEKLMNFKKTISYTEYVIFFDLILLVILWWGVRLAIEDMKSLQMTAKFLPKPNLLFKIEIQLLFEDFLRLF